jgi:hypothetical protein
MIINGRAASFPKGGPMPRYYVRPGEHLVMKVAVTVPKHFRLTALWLGISGDTWSGGPRGLHPVLAHSRQPLSAGVHTFGLRWRVPDAWSGRGMYLLSTWSSAHPPAEVAGGIAKLARKW